MGRLNMRRGRTLTSFWPLSMIDGWLESVSDTTPLTLARCSVVLLYRAATIGGLYM
jgi:hypothetical protein